MTVAMPKLPSHLPTSSSEQQKLYRMAMRHKAYAQKIVEDDRMRNAKLTLLLYRVQILERRPCATANKALPPPKRFRTSLRMRTSGVR